MVENHLSGYFSSLPTAVAVATEAAFVPCPVCGLMSSMQLQQVAQIYQMAAQMTREQLQPKRNPIPEFSLN